MSKILIVEDNALFRETLKDSIIAEFPEIQVELAANGKEALIKVDWFRPNLIFMDLRLPGEMGSDLTKRIKAKFPKTNVAILTSYDLPEYRETAAERGAECFLVKGSSTPEDIFRQVRNYANS